MKLYFFINILFKLFNWKIEINILHFSFGAVDSVTVVVGPLIVTVVIFRLSVVVIVEAVGVSVTFVVGIVGVGVVIVGVAPQYLNVHNGTVSRW